MPHGAMVTYEDVWSQVGGTDAAASGSRVTGCKQQAGLLVRSALEAGPRLAPGCDHSASMSGPAAWPGRVLLCNYGRLPT
jgi:hypothetical protein